jgi:hypothetical protein
MEKCGRSSAGTGALSEARAVVKGMPWALKGPPSRASQKIVIFIIIAVRISDLTFPNLIPFCWKFLCTISEAVTYVNLGTS